MSKINWKVRYKNRAFWVALIPAMLLVIQIVASIFGITIDLGELGNKLISLINAIFAVLAIIGIVNDPTTASLSDSETAMTYETPKED